MPEMRASVEFQVWCSCGEGLCNQSTGGTDEVTVEPCNKCLEEAKSEADSGGYDRGYDEGFADGKQQAEA